MNLGEINDDEFWMREREIANAQVSGVVPGSNVSSPPPLTITPSAMMEEEDEQIRRLAQRLAPQVQELDALLLSPVGPVNDIEEDSRRQHNDDDDSLEDELARLEASQQLLRQELDFAHDFGSVLGPPSLKSGENSREVPDCGDAIEEEEPHTDTQGEKSAGNISTTSDNNTHPRTPPSHKPPLQTTPLRTPPLAVPKNKYKPPAPSTPATRTSSSTTPSVPMSYSFSDHSHALQITKEPRGGWYVVPHVQIDPDGGLREYVIPLPSNELGRLYVGLLVEGENAADTSTEVTSVMSPTNPGTSASFEPLPVRVLTMQVRPDVLVGSIMEAVAAGLGVDGDMSETTMLRRQGGHLEATTKIYDDQYLRVDAQVTTYKGAGGRFCERTLVLRFFHYEPQVPTASRTRQQEEPFLHLEPDLDLVEQAKKSNLLLKEAAALIQKLETSKMGTSSRNPSSTRNRRKHTFFFAKQQATKTREEMQEAVREELLTTYRPCPSVKDGPQLTLPILSTHDGPAVQAAWKTIAHIWDELEDRDLTYNTLTQASCPFGQFPALPTLDVHYCSQLRRVCRENMILSLLKSASELEEYARDAEYACAHLVQVLKATYELYSIRPPNLPQPLPLTAYPLDFVPHQVACPPWGRLVMEALQKVAAMNSVDGNRNSNSSLSSLDRCERAVQMVLDAFQIQDDEEQSARLQRKNIQVMDRLAKMQAHKRVSIETLQRSYAKSTKAQQAAHDLHEQIERSSPSAPNLSVEEQVPLFKCSVLVGSSSTGTFYVTSRQLICTTAQFLPLLMGSKVNVINLEDELEFVVIESKTNSLLYNPLPDGLSIRKNDEELLLIRPSYGASRLKTFLEIVQATHQQNEGRRGGSVSRSSSNVSGGGANNGALLYVYGDTPPPKR